MRATSRIVGHVIFTLSGDEFALIVPRVDAAGTRSIVERARLATKGRLPGITVSAGVAALGWGGEDLLLGHALHPFVNPC